MSGRATLAVKVAPSRELRSGKTISIVAPLVNSRLQIVSNVLENRTKWTWVPRICSGGYSDGVSYSCDVQWNQRRIRKNHSEDVLYYRSVYIYIYILMCTVIKRVRTYKRFKRGNELRYRRIFSV